MTVRGGATVVVLLLLAALPGVGGCVLAPIPGGSAGASFHLAEVAHEGDPRRRASTRLVLDGLEADAALRPDEAALLYGRALQLDPTNPYAHLALARQRAEGPDPLSALPMLERAESMLRAQGDLPPGLAAHLAGLRGMALLAAGRREQAEPLLRRARELDPAAWSDGRLDPAELR